MKTKIVGAMTSVPRVTVTARAMTTRAMTPTRRMTMVDKKRVIVLLAGPLLVLVLMLAYPTVVAGIGMHVASVCTDTGLTGPSLQENQMFCANGVSMAGSVYQASIALARQKHIIVGTPTSVVNTVDWAGASIAYVTFTSGFHAQHHSDLFVRIYDALDRQVYP
jgi:hypothetical protein